MELFFYIASFWLFSIAQSFAINGVHYCFKGTSVKDINGKMKYDGNVFYMMAPEFFEQNKYKWWSLPLWKCVRCQSSIWGSITFWPTIISIFGFHWYQVGIWAFDLFILVTLNWIVYKKL